MNTKNDAATRGQSLPVEADDLQVAEPAAWKRRVRPVFCQVGGVVLLAAVAFSQVTPLQIVPLAQGLSQERNVILAMKGGTDVLQSDLIFQPGATTGWHIHPGPVVVVVKSGKLTEVHSDGCMSVHETGSAFFEPPGEVHNVINQTGEVTEVYATFLSPTGAQPLVTVADPGNRCGN